MNRFLRIIGGFVIFSGLGTAVLGVCGLPGAIPEIDPFFTPFQGIVLIISGAAAALFGYGLLTEGAEE